MTLGASAYDAIVVGGGHNGLVCAAYLARAGLRTLIVEQRAEVGGMAGTSELVPGVRVPTLAHTVGRLTASVARDLRLRDYGLALVQPAVRVFAPQPDGRAITLWGDVERTAAELARTGVVSPADAAAYPHTNQRLRALASGLGTILGRTPPDIASPSLGDALDAVRAGLDARRRGRRSDEVGLLRILPKAVRDLVEEWFESDALRAVVAARGVLLTSLGPRMPGTSAVLLTDSAGNDGRLAGQSVLARGGTGAVSGALLASAGAAGAELRTGCQVVAIRRSADGVSGVALAGGEEIEAPIVVSNLDPRSTLLGLLEPEVLGPRLSWRASNVRQRGATAKVNFALSELPRFPAAAGDERRLRGRILIAPGMDALDRAADPAKYGLMTDEPLLEATIPTLVDPALIDGARAGEVRHVMSVVAQSFPYDLRDGTWDERREELGNIVSRTLETFAPGFSDLVEARQVITPLDIERDYGVSGGHPMHAEVGLDQWFAWRPLHGYGRYRMPLSGFYLCGSGAHPGGGVTGAPGQLAAREILADSRGQR